MFFELCNVVIVVSAVLVFIFIAWIDCRTMEIPDWCHLVLIGLGAVQIGFGALQIGLGESIPLESRGLGLIAMSLPMILANLLSQDSFGGGDIKMCAAAGFLLGASQMMIGSLMALMFAGVYGSFALLLRTKKPKDSFPLGPFLSVGFIAVMLGGLLDYGF